MGFKVYVVFVGLGFRVAGFRVWGLRWCRVLNYSSDPRVLSSPRMIHRLSSAPSPQSEDIRIGLGFRV